MGKQQECPYDTLSVPRDATLQQIKSSYRKLALRYHPDKQHHRGETEEERARNSEVFTRISNAYEILSDEGRRREYNLYGHGGRDAAVAKGQASAAAESSSRRAPSGTAARTESGQRRPQRGAASSPFGESFGTYGGRGGDPFFDDPFFRSAGGMGGARGSQRGGVGFGGGGFTDPFELFERVFGEEFGTMGGHFGHPSARKGANAGRAGGGGRDGGFFDDPFANDPFFSGMGGGGGGFGSMSSMMSSMTRQMDAMMSQSMNGAHAHSIRRHHGGMLSGSGGGHTGHIGSSSRAMSHQGGGHHGMSSYSSSSSYGGGGGGGMSQSVSTTTRIVNGRSQTVTERTVVHPDGTVQRHVETSTGGGLDGGDALQYSQKQHRGGGRGFGFIERDHAR